MYYLFGLMKGFILFEKSPLIKFFLLVMLLGTLTEVVQLWVPERAFNVFDLVSNVAGVTFGVCTIKMIQGQRGKRNY